MCRNSILCEYGNKAENKYKFCIIIDNIDISQNANLKFETKNMAKVNSAL